MVFKGIGISSILAFGRFPGLVWFNFGGDGCLKEQPAHLNLATPVRIHLKGRLIPMKTRYGDSRSLALTRSIRSLSYTSESTSRSLWFVMKIAILAALFLAACLLYTSCEKLIAGVGKRDLGIRGLMIEAGVAVALDS